MNSVPTFADSRPTTGQRRELRLGDEARRLQRDAARRCRATRCGWRRSARCRAGRRPARRGRAPRCTGSAAGGRTSGGSSSRRRARSTNGNTSVRGRRCLRRRGAPIARRAQRRGAAAATPARRRAPSRASPQDSAPNRSWYARADRVAVDGVVLPAATRDLERAQERREPARSSPVPAVRDAVEQSRAIRVAAPGRIDQRRRRAPRESRSYAPSTWMREPSAPSVTISASTRRASVIERERRCARQAACPRSR